MSSNETSSRIVHSPCCGVCVLNANDICEGCFRSADEIATWTAMAISEREEVLHQCLLRAKQAGRIF